MLRKGIVIVATLLFLVPSLSPFNVVWATAVQSREPIITNVIVTMVEGGIQVTWNTSVPATSSVNYGTSIGYGFNRPGKGSLETNHSVFIPNSELMAVTRYHIQAISTDVFGGTGHSVDKTVYTGSGDGYRVVTTEVTGDPSVYVESKSQTVGPSVSSYGSYGEGRDTKVISAAEIEEETVGEEEVDGSAFQTSILGSGEGFKGFGAFGDFVMEWWWLLIIIALIMGYEKMRRERKRKE